MANTGWRLTRCIVKVASSDNTKKLDRDGLECNLVDSEGIPVSVTGKRQAARVLSTVDINTETPIGQVKTYAQLYDITGTYTVDTIEVPTTTLIYDQGAVVGQFRGGSSQECTIEQVIVFTSTPPSQALAPLGESVGVNLLITSTVDGVETGWSVYSKPSWLTCTPESNNLKLTFPRNESGMTRSGSIVLKQTGTDELLSIDISQETAYGNDELFEWVQRNNCISGNIGDYGKYTIPANTYWSTSKSAANILAQDDIDLNKQEWANDTLGCYTKLTINWSLTYYQSLDPYEGPLKLVVRPVDPDALPEFILDEVSILSTDTEYIKNGVLELPVEQELSFFVQGIFAGGSTEELWETRVFSGTSGVMDVSVSSGVGNTLVLDL